MRQGKQRFHPEANMHYRVRDIDSLTVDLLQDMIKHHEDYQRPRLRELREYYKGNNQTILQQYRRKDDHLADNRATHNFAKYVSQFIQGYLMGVPLKTSYPDEGTDELLRNINRINDADEHNTNLVLDQSIFGRAYELLYRSRDDEIRFVLLDVLDTFVIYDETVECNPLAGVRRIDNKFNDSTTILLYTQDKVYVYDLRDGYHLHKQNEEEHKFGDVPIVEYANDRYRQGDFEDVLSLIDLYDAAQSDTANYMQDLNDAMLKIVGNLDLDIEEAKMMKESNLLMLQTEQTSEGTSQNADADYIYKQYDVQGTEAYKDRLFNNILLFTSIPNLLDEEGTTAQSGEALKMKLFALSQKRAIKERLFKKSLRNRYRLINNIMSLASEGSFDVNRIDITFTENLPSMIDKELEWFTKAGGQLSQETLIENLSFVDNAKEEMERMQNEDDQAIQSMRMFGFPESEES